MQWFDNVQTKRRLVTPLSDFKLRLTAQDPTNITHAIVAFLLCFFVLVGNVSAKPFVMVTFEMGQKSKTRSIVDNTHNVAGGSETGLSPFCVKQ